MNGWFIPINSSERRSSMQAVFKKATEDAKGRHYIISCNVSF